MKRNVRRWALIFALGGLLSASISTWVHVQLLRNPGYLSFCDISSTLNCSQAYLSAFGSVAGIPVAIIGVGWFTVVLVLLGLERRGPAATRENVPGYLFALSTLALAAVLYLAYGSFVLLRTVCVLCLITYVAVIGIFWLSGAATPFAMTSLPRRAWRDLRALAARPVALVLVILLITGTALVVAFVPRETSGPAPAASQVSGEQQSEFEKWYSTLPRVQVPGVATDGAKVVVVKFNDYQCPPCRQTYLNYQGIFSRYQAEQPGAVKVVTKDFPLDPECNLNAPNGSHLAACEAAVAVRLARARKQDEKMAAWLFANQTSLTPALVRQGAREVGSVTEFEAEYARLLEQVKADTALGGLLGVRVTPTFFINGAKIEGGLQPQWFDAAIAWELNHAK